MSLRRYLNFSHFIHIILVNYLHSWWKVAENSLTEILAVEYSLQGYKISDFKEQI